MRVIATAGCPTAFPFVSIVDDEHGLRIKITRRGFAANVTDAIKVDPQTLLLIQHAIADALASGVCQ